MLWFLIACAGPSAPPADPAPNVDADAPAAAPEGTAATPDRSSALPPRIQRIALTPTSPAASEPLRVDVTADHPAGAHVELGYVWLVNDVEVPGARSDSLRPGPYRKGDRIAVRVRASVGGRDVERMSDPAVVRNTSPEFTSQPTDPRRLNGFRFGARDPDGDELTWSIEGAPPGMTLSPDGQLSYVGSRTAAPGSYTVQEPTYES